MHLLFFPLSLSFSDSLKLKMIVVRIYSEISNKLKEFSAQHRSVSASSHRAPVFPQQTAPFPEFSLSFQFRLPQGMVMFSEACQWCFSAFLVNHILNPFIRMRTRGRVGSFGKCFSFQAKGQGLTKCFSYLQVFGNAPPNTMTEKFSDLLQFTTQVSRLMVTEIRRRASNKSTGIYRGVSGADLGRGWLLAKFAAEMQQGAVWLHAHGPQPQPLSPQSLLPAALPCGATDPSTATLSSPCILYTNP